jgi:DNA polymerase-1
MSQMWVCHAVGKRLPSGALQPVAMYAKELTTGQEMAGEGAVPWSHKDSTLVAFPGHTVIETLNASGCCPPESIIDLYAEHRAATNGKTAGDGTADPCLAKACAAWGLPCHTNMTDEEAAASGRAHEHCQAVVDAGCALLQAMPLDRSQALSRGRYAATVAAMQERGIPVSQNLKSFSATALDELRLVAQAEFPLCFLRGRWARESVRRWLHSLRLGKVTASVDGCRRHEDPRVQRVGEIAAVLQKLEQLNRVCVDHDERSRTNLRPYAAVTGRNQPRGYAWEIAKPLIHPPAGKVLAIIDYCQQEFGIAAHLSKDHAMIADYVAGDAYLRFGVRAELCTPNDQQARALLKQAVLPTMYGASAETLTAQYGLTHEAARTVITTFDRAYTRCREWMMESRGALAQQGIIKTPFGWHFYAPKECPDDFSKLLRTAGNFPVQANGTEILWEACRRLHAAGIPLCGTLHDAVMVEAEADIAAEVFAMAEAIMQEASCKVLGAALRTATESIGFGEQFRSQQRFWSSVNRLLASTKEACP